MSPKRDRTISEPAQGGISPQHSSPKQHRFRLMEERIQQCNVEIDRLQRDLFKTQEDLRRSESTIDAQLEIEAKMIEEKARLSRQTFNLELLLYVCWKTPHPKLAAQILRGRSLRGWYKTMFEGEEFEKRLGQSKGKVLHPRKNQKALAIAA